MPSHTDLPRIVVLLATYNGAPWLDEQLQSIFAQRGVDVRVVASDDRSADRTPALLADWAAASELQCLPPSAGRLGNANRNFLRLISDSDIGDAEYVALADQDDIWHEDKLRRAVTCIDDMSLDAYSSDVVAFWSDGRQVEIRKSQPQRRYDHLFESAGPGCTFVMRRSAFNRLRQWVVQNLETLGGLSVHDWLIYAYARREGWKWFIDDRALMRYRQHQRNEVGANAGWKAIRRRLERSLSGSFRRDVLAIADAVGETSWPVQALRRFGPLDRLRLIASASQLRRRRRDRLVLAAMLLVMRRKDSSAPS